MDTHTLQSIGLNETQSKVYMRLVRDGACTPPQLASKLKLTRTNAYAVLDQLEEMELVTKFDKNKKLVYKVENPIALEKLATKNRKKASEKEQAVQQAMPSLLSYFYTYSDQPGIRFFQGVDGIKEIYNDTLRTRKDIYVIRSPHDQDLMSLKYYVNYKNKRAKLGITTHMLNSSTDEQIWNERTDRVHNIKRTKMRKQDYTSEVEISTYGDKVAIISFGTEAIGTIIESPQIADAMKQVYMLAAEGARALACD